jgi:hypothetical protein
VGQGRLHLIALATADKDDTLKNILRLTVVLLNAAYPVRRDKKPAKTQARQRKARQKQSGTRIGGSTMPRQAQHLLGTLQEVIGCITAAYGTGSIRLKITKFFIKI